MAHGWRKRLGLIGTGMVISTSLIGCHNDDKKTVTAPPVSKSATAAGQRSPTTPAVVPGVMPPPGSIAPTSQAGASQSNMSPQVGIGGFGSAGPSSPTMGYNTPQNFPSYPGSSGANPNNPGTMGGATPQGTIGPGAPIPGARPIGPTSSAAPTGGSSDPLMTPPNARGTAPGTSTTSSYSTANPPFAELNPSAPLPPGPPTNYGPQAPSSPGPNSPSVTPYTPPNIPLAPIAPGSR